MKIWFFGRLYYPFEKSGGAQIRYAQVQELKAFGWDVNVVVPNYNSSENLVSDENIFQLGFHKRLKYLSILQRVGIYEDYLDGWIKNAFNFLKKQIKEEDIIFATSGGELGMIKLASLLKELTGCKVVVNFHDPLDYSVVNGMRLNNKFHVSREKSQSKYLKNADLIITSSIIYQKALQKKFPKLKQRIKNSYFGYIKKIDLESYKKESSKKLRVAYAGNMANTQKPEILYEAYKKLSKEYKDKIHIYFIGNVKNYKPLLNIDDKNISFISYLEHEEFLKFMVQNVDVGFVSLVSEYFGLCVPSKIYEYINLSLPMLGALPDGDAKEIINKNHYGMVHNYNDIDALAKTLESWIDDNSFLQKSHDKILQDKDRWYIKNSMSDVDRFLKELTCKKS